MENRLTRRAFAGSAALGALAIAGTGPEAPAQPQDPEPPPVPDPLRAEVDARMGIILARFADRLDDEALESIREGVADQVRRAIALKRIPLDNGASPCPIFIPHRGPGEPPADAQR